MNLVGLIHPDLKQTSAAGEASSPLREAGGGDDLWSCFVSVIRRHANPAAAPRSALWRVPA